MLLAYIDETAPKSGGNYYVVGMIVGDDGATHLSDALDALMIAKSWKHIELSPRAELHGHELMQGKGDWKSLRTEVRARIEVYREALAAIAEHIEGFYVRGLNRERFEARYEGRGFDEHTAVMAFLFEELDEHCLSRGEKMLCIADECGREAAVRADLRKFRTTGTWGWRSRKITSIVDTVHFAASKDSRLIQAVDLVAFIYLRHHDHVSTPQSAAATADLWSVIAHRHLAAKPVWLP